MKTFVAALSLSLLSSPTQARSETVPDTSAARLARETAPQLFAYTQEVLFGDVWKRPNLSPRDRSLVTIAALVANGQGAQMAAHINLGLDNGVKPGEVIGLITHLAFYSGWPNAASAVGVAKIVFEERSITSPQLQPGSSELLPLDAASEAKRKEIVKQSSGVIAPDLARYTDDVLFGDLWRQPALALRDRSLITIAALIARGQSEQLNIHLNRAMDNGLTRAELSEVVTHLAFYAGWPRAMSALPAMKAVFDARH